jgi:hypothetical protein
LRPGTGPWQAKKHGRFLFVMQGCVATPSIEETAVPRSSARHISESSAYDPI